MKETDQLSVMHLLFSALRKHLPKLTLRQVPQISAYSQQRFVMHDRAAWLAHWQILGQDWRTEPEINKERQGYLAQQRAILPDVQQGLYPFKGIRLSRADVEWLLATHEHGRGPVDWSDEKQREREGLDLRGADLRNIDLSQLPLARTRGGIIWNEWPTATEEQHHTAAIHLEGADLHSAHLEGIDFGGAYLDHADLHHAFLEQAVLRWAKLESANLFEAHLEKADLGGANLKDADLGKSHMEGVALWAAHLEQATLTGAYVAGADFKLAFFDHATRLRDIVLCDKERGCALLADLSWGEANLTGVTWSQVNKLGDEQRARQKMQDGQRKEADSRLKEYETAVRANRQLAVALQAQGMKEEASRFAYRAEVLQRIAWRRQWKLGQYLLSLLLDACAGYGYKPGRCFVIYVLTLAIFTTAHYAVGVIAGPQLTWLGALAISVQGLHGRIFSFQPGDPQILLNTVEAFVGLFIEAIVVAVITQRILGK